MNDLAQYSEHMVDLHSEVVQVIRRMVNGKPFDIAVTNGRTGVWARRFHDIEPEFLAWCGLLDPKDVLWDLGASIGHFAAYAALISGAKVYAFEPEAQNFSQCALTHYLNFNHLGDRLVPLGFGIAHRSGLHNMSIRLYGAGEHTKTIGPDVSPYTTPALLLGLQEVLALGITPPSAVKIDVDGSEAEVVTALTPVWSSVSHVFIELPLAQLGRFTDEFSSFGLKLRDRHRVARMRGGYYDDIVNVTFVRA